MKRWCGEATEGDFAHTYIQMQISDSSSSFSRLEARNYPGSD
jgi:hypothetical protein